jgi:GTPase SAR1 family protein
MYTLLSGLYKYYTRKEEYNVLIIGLDNAGKTVNTNILLYFDTIRAIKSDLSSENATST